MLALVATSAMAFSAAVASATTVRSGSATGPAYSGSVTATLQSGTQADFKSSFVNASCDTSTISGTTNSSGSGSISSASWTDGGSGCGNNIGGTCTSTAQNLNWGSTAVDGGKKTDYMVTSGMKVQVVCTDWFGTKTTCYYIGNNASGDGAGTLRGDTSDPAGSPQAPGKLTYPSASDTTANLLKDTGSSFACSSTASFTATYDVVGDSGVHLWITP